MFSNISRYYLDNILQSKLDVKNIARFTIDYFSMVAAKLRDALVLKNIIDLIRSFDIYFYIVINFVAKPIKMELIRVITLYCLRIIIMLNYKTFVSIRLYYEKFVACVIRLS